MVRALAPAFALSPPFTLATRTVIGFELKYLVLIVGALAVSPGHAVLYIWLCKKQATRRNLARR